MTLVLLFVALLCAMAGWGLVAAILTLIAVAIGMSNSKPQPRRKR